MQPSATAFAEDKAAGEPTMPEVAKAVETLIHLRAEAYSRLERLFAEPPAVAQARQAADFFAEYAPIAESGGGALTTAARKLKIACAQPMTGDALESEFNRLFVGPGRLAAPPYGSVYTTVDRVVFGKSAIEARAAYQEAGFSAAEASREPDDHIATELGFMLALQKKFADAFGAGEDGRPWLCRQTIFLEKHMLTWIPQFLERTRDKTKIPFFAALSDFTGEALKGDLLVLESMETALAGLYGGGAASEKR